MIEKAPKLEKKIIKMYKKKTKNKLKVTIFSVL